MQVRASYAYVVLRGLRVLRVFACFYEFCAFLCLLCFVCFVCMFLVRMGSCIIEKLLCIFSNDQSYIFMVFHNSLRIVFP